MSHVAWSQEPQLTRRTPPGVNFQNRSEDPRITRDGRFLVLSTAQELTAEDPFGKRQIFRHDRATNTTILVSRKDGAGSVIANQHCDVPSVSDDGNVIVFETTAKLVVLDTNTATDIYARIVSTNHTFLLSRGRDSLGNAVASNGVSFDAAVSGNGQFAAFTSAATNLLFPNNLDGNNLQDVFVVATNPAGFAERVSLNDSNQEAAMTQFTTAGGSGLGVGRVISNDGLLVLFHGRPCDWSSAAGSCNITESVHHGNCLCPDADNDCTGAACGAGAQQVYLRDRAAPGSARTFRVSRVFNAGPTGTFCTGIDVFCPGNGVSRRASFNETATRTFFSVVWSSTSNNFPGDADTFEDVFRIAPAPGTPENLDLTSLNPVRISVPMGGMANNGQSTAPMEADGFVAFESAATNLVSGDTNTKRDIFVADIGASPFVVVRVNSSSSGAQATGGDSKNPCLSRKCVAPTSPGDCDQVVVYESSAINLDPSDANGRQDIFEGVSKSFIRGDLTEIDRRVNDDDFQFLSNFLQFGDCSPDCVFCLSTADVNDDGAVNQTDLVFLSNFLTFGVPLPPHPSPLPFGQFTPACGKDRTLDGQSCEFYLTEVLCTE